MGIYEHGKGLAEAIIIGQEVARSLPKPAPPPPTKIEFVEMPKALSYYYPPHKYKLVSAGSHETIYEFEVPPEHVFHIEFIGTNYFDDTYLLFEVDGSLLEKVERFFGAINSPVSVKGRYIVAKNKVRWVCYNESTDDIISEVYCDGTIYHVEDFPKVVGRF